MILEQQKQSIVLSKGEETNTSIKMSLDLDSAQILMQMLSKNLYSDGIGSAIRETCSNALDSHRKANTDKPIIVSLLKNKEDNYEFSVEDFGTGLDDQDVENILSKYGKSTKRDSNKFLGAMGLGWKSPLAYSSSFYFICRKNGIKRKYMMYEGEDVNTIDLLYSTPSEKENGVKVIIPVKNNDVSEFYKKIKEQLCYFENVYFNVPEQSSYPYTSGIDNSFSILRKESYQISELCNEEEMHICLDNVYYPIDFNALGVSRLYIPIGLRFSLSDGLFPTPNREQLIYSEQTKKIILEKIKIVCDELMTKYNEQISEKTFTLMTAVQYYNQYEYFVKIDDKLIDLNEIEKHSSIKKQEPVVNGIEYLNIKNISYNSDRFLNEYFISHECYHGRFTTISKHKLIFNEVVKYNTQKYKFHKEPITSKQKNWYRENLHSATYFIKKDERRNFSLFGKYYNDNHNYVDLLALRQIEKKHWRKAIIEFQTAINDVIYSLDFVDDFEVPKVWIEKEKKQKSTRSSLLEGEFSCKIAQRLERFVQGQECKFVPTTLQYNSLYKYGGLTIFDLYDNKHLLDSLFKTLGYKVRFISVNQKVYNQLESLNIHNVISYNTFMKGKNKAFKRLATRIKIHKLINENRRVFNYPENLKNVSLTFNKELELLNDYNKSFYMPSEEVQKAVLETAEANQLFDYSIYHVYEKVKDKLEKLYFLDFLITKSYNEYGTQIERQRILIDMMKYYKQRVNLENYKLKPEINEEIKEAV